jgi:Flp pilus assembly protein TadD
LHTARQWLEVEPENIEAHRAVGESLIILDREAEAERHIRHVLAARPNDDVAHRWMSYVHSKAFALGAGGARLKAAEESLQKAISLNPQDPFHWFGLALLCQAQYDFTSAKEFLAKALELDPRNPAFSRLVIDCEPTNESNVAEKLAQYHKALELDPQNAGIHSDIGVCHLNYTGNFQAAEKSFRRALFFNPSSKTARSSLFITLKHRDRIYRALHAPRDLLLKVGSYSMPDSLLYMLTVPYLLYTSLFIGLAFWFILFWPLVKAYEYLTIGDIHSKAGEVGAKRGGLLGYRRLSLSVRLIIFATFLAAFWGSSTLFLLNRYSSSIKHAWNILCTHPIRFGLMTYGCCLFFWLIFAYFYMKHDDRVQRGRSENHARRRAKIFGTPKPKPKPEPEEVETTPAETPSVIETEPVRFRPDWADFP